MLKVARKGLDSHSWRFLLVFSCVLVFTFAFHAKVAAYYHHSQLDGSTSSKLYLNGDKLQAPAQLADLTGFWLLAFFALLQYARPAHLYSELRQTPVPSMLDQLNLRYFFRPPPQN